MSKKASKASDSKGTWRNRIVRHAVVPAGEIVKNPKNWRIHTEHQRDALEGVLDAVGWVQDVVVNERTGRLVDGEMRATSAAKRNERVPVTYVDLTEEEEALMLAAMDPIGQMAVTGHEALMALLGDVEVANPALDQMFYALVEQAEQTSLKDEQAEQSETEGTGQSKKGRNLGSPAAMIKPVLYSDQIAVFEEALKATGIRNRGEAVIEVCRVYLEQQRTEGQFDLSAKS